MKKSLFFFVALVLCIAILGSCKKKKDACDNINCNNGGSCVNGSCKCDSVHEGANCESEKRAKYFGGHVFNIDCSSGDHLDYAKFLSSDSGANKIEIVNLYSSGSACFGTLLADGSIDIASQELVSQSLGTGTISGRASMINDKIVISFMAAFAGNLDTCTWTQRW